MILLMLSGGLDSTGALYKVLTETDELIHVHHVSLRNQERRWMAEDHAVNQIISYCRNLRNFKFTTSVYEFLQFQKFIGWDNDIIRFIAAQICKNDDQIKYLALGKCADDESLAFELRAIQAAAIWKSCFLDTPWNPPEIIRPVENLTKKQIWEMLPEELRKNTWSCRTPEFKPDNKTFYYCMKCGTCQKLVEYGIIKNS